jgi:hypothetical protein
MPPIIDWYFPWARIDDVLKVELLVWLAVVGVSYWIFWRTVVRGRPWLRRRNRK